MKFMIRHKERHLYVTNYVASTQSCLSIHHAKAREFDSLKEAKMALGHKIIREALERKNFESTDFDVYPSHLKKIER